jgi:hypothetical protein
MKSYIQYLEEEPRWKPIKYMNIIDGYEVSDRGIIRTTEGRIIQPHKLENEKGYCRVSLQLTNGKRKKFGVHRQVMIHFSPTDNKFLEVNHKDTIKNNNVWTNLEWNTRLENAAHAARNNLYQKGQDRPKSNFTDDQVHEICRLLSEGMSICNIIDHMNLIGKRGNLITYILRIQNDITWRHITQLYIWDRDIIRYKTYDKSDIEDMCKYLSEGKTVREIVSMFIGKYDGDKLRNVIKKISQGKLYNDIWIKYNRTPPCSTTSQ